MCKKIVILLTLSCVCNVLAQKHFNQQLKNELDFILDTDQLLREYSIPSTSDSRKTEILNKTGYTTADVTKGIWNVINKQDSINLVKVERIIEKYGYPGKSMVGEPTNKAVWYVIQHSKKISNYFDLIKTAGKQGEIPMTLVAMMEDRKLMYEGKEQIYGTQGAGRLIYDQQGKEMFFNFIWPIANETHCNERRKAVGFANTIEEYAKDLEIPYVKFTMEDFKKLRLVERRK